MAVPFWQTPNSPSPAIMESPAGLASRGSSNWSSRFGLRCTQVIWKQSARFSMKRPNWLSVSPGPTPAAIKPIEGVSSGCVWHRPQQTQIAGMLADAGADLDITVAARAGLVDRVRQMLDDDPSLINARDGTGRTAIYRAGCVFGRFDEREGVVDLMLERGAMLDFYVACTFCMVEDVERLLDEDASWAARLDPDGMSCLHWACRPRRKDGAVVVTRMLLEAGADVTAANPQEEQMLPIHHCGEWAAYAEQVDLLLEHGADINAAAGNGWTALDYAMDRGRKRHGQHSPGTRWERVRYAYKLIRVHKGQVCRCPKTELYDHRQLE